MAKRPVQKYDFTPFGKAIKSARNEQKESRNKVGNEMYLSPRYLANIENKGQHPSLQIFFELVTRYHISVDQLLFGDATESKSTARRQLDPLLDGMTEVELKIVIEPFPQKRTQNRMKKPNKNTKIRCTAIRRRKRQVQLQSEQAKASRGQNGGGWCCKRLRDRQRHRPVQLPL